MKLKMIINIFRIFDPSTSKLLSLNWLRLLIIFALTPYPYWIYLSRFQMLLNLFINTLYNEFKILIKYSQSNLIILISLFFIILRNNFFGLFPYIFTSSRHMRFCLSLSLSIWMGIITYAIINYFNDTCSHLTPFTNIINGIIRAIIKNYCPINYVKGSNSFDYSGNRSSVHSILCIYNFKNSLQKWNLIY